MAREETAVGIKAERHLNPCLEVIARNKDKIVRNVLEFLRRKGLNHKEIWIYKSRVAGTCRKNSDIDIYVQLEEKYRELVEKEGNMWGEKKGLDWGREARQMGLTFIEETENGWPIELDIRMACDTDPPYNPKYDGKRYSMRLSEVKPCLR